MPALPGRGGYHDRPRGESPRGALASGSTAVVSNDRVLRPGQSPALHVRERRDPARHPQLRGRESEFREGRLLHVRVGARRALPRRPLPPAVRHDGPGHRGATPLPPHARRHPLAVARSRLPEGRRRLQSGRRRRGGGGLRHLQGRPQGDGHQVRLELGGPGRAELRAGEQPVLREAGGGAPERGRDRDLAHGNRRPPAGLRPLLRRQAGGRPGLRRPRGAHRRGRDELPPARPTTRTSSCSTGGPSPTSWGRR